MNDVIFAVPRYHYASYADLYALIHLSNFPTCFIDEIDQASDNTYVVTIYNGEFGSYSGSRARIYLADLEYHLGDNALPALPNVTLLAADRWYAEQIGARYAPLGSHRLLATSAPGSQAEQYDVAYLGFIQGLARRERMREQLTASGVRVSPMVAWGEERDRVLRASRAYFTCHQHEHVPTIAPLRMVVAAAYSLPVITETCADAGVFDPLLYRAPYGELAHYTAWAKYDSQLTQVGAALHYLLCEQMPFRKSIESVL